MENVTSKKRADGQMSGLAGEFFVAAELLKRDIQTSVTFGNAKAIDLLAHNAETCTSYTIQVKALRANNYFLLDPRKLVADHVYVFLLLNGSGQHVRYFIVPGSELIEHPDRFGRGFRDPKLPGILPRDLADFEDNWAVFGCPR
ncbi:MAG: hypothetical protein KKA32_14555 [Actinobacteria bacterium]|nr:hypothetical protein [Actinomycetota bacterium]